MVSGFKKYILNGVLIAFSLLLSVGVMETYLRVAEPYWLTGRLLLPPGINVDFETREFKTRVRTNQFGLRGDDVQLARGDAVRIAAVGDSFTFGWGVDETQTYPEVLERLLAERLDRSVEVINFGRPGESPVGYLRTFNLHAQRFQSDVVVVGFVPANDCPVDESGLLETQAEIDAQVARLVAEAERPWKEIRFYLSRLVTTRITKPIRAWARGRESDTPGVMRDPIDHGGNPLDPARLGPRLHGDAVRTARYERLKQAGWVKQGETWAISPWLVNFAIFNPDFPARALMLDEKTKALMARRYQVCEGVLKATADKVRASGAAFVLALLPAPAQVSGDYLKVRHDLGIDIPDAALTDRTVNDRLMAFCARENLTCVDGLPAQRRAEARGEALYYPIDGHATAAGYALMARTLAPVVQQAVQKGATR